MKVLVILSACFLLLQGCKIVQTVGTGGTVVSESGQYGCAEGQTCEIDIPNGQPFAETFTAVPAEGYEFAGWRSSESYLCVGNDVSCVVDIPAMLTRYDLTGYMTVEFVETDGSSPVSGEPAITTIVQQSPLPEDPHYTIIQSEGRLQYWLANDAEPAQALYIDSEGQKTRVYDDEDDAVSVIVDEYTGDFIKFLYRDAFRTDVLMFDSVGTFQFGVAVFEQDERYFVGEIEGKSAFENYEQRSRKVRGENRDPISNDTLYFKLNSNLINVSELPAEFIEFVEQLQSVDDDAGGFSSGFLIASSADQTLRSKAVRGMMALAGVVVAVKTGQVPRLIANASSRFVNIAKNALVAEARGQSVTESVTNGIVDAFSLCRLARSQLEVICDTTTDIMSGDIDGDSAVDYLADAVLGNVDKRIPAVFGDLSRVRDLLNIDHSDRDNYEIEPGQQPIPQASEGAESRLPVLLAPATLILDSRIVKSSTDLGTAAETQQGDVVDYRLEGLVQPDGSFELTGCPINVDPCTDEHRMTQRGRFTLEDGSAVLDWDTFFWRAPQAWGPHPTISSCAAVDVSELNAFSLTGFVVDAGSSPISGAIVTIATVDCDYSVTSASDGSFTLRFLSDTVPEDLVLTVYKAGYIPEALAIDLSNRNALNIGSVILEQLSRNVVVLELVPELHHLGDDNFTGAINSAFQRRAEGTLFTKNFSLSPDQTQASAATFSLLAKGLQNSNEFRINDNIVAYLDSSPSDGSFGVITGSISMSFFRTGDNELAIESDQNFFGDYDDFEFTNVVIRFEF